MINEKRPLRSGWFFTKIDMYLERFYESLRKGTISPPTLVCNFYSPALEHTTMEHCHSNKDAYHG